jgi:hypothetical protein
VFVVGGAEHFYRDYPLTGTPALDAMYHGATAIFNGNGNFYQKPMEVINAEYSWNYHSTGFSRDPGSWDEAMHLNLTYMFAKNQPRELFGPNSIYERACELLYGPEAGAIMESYYRDFQWVPETAPERMSGRVCNGIWTIVLFLCPCTTGRGPLRGLSPAKRTNYRNGLGYPREITCR